MFEAVFDGNLFKIPEVSQSAHITYNFWHQALGHPAPSSMDQALQMYSNADIPAKPKDFICSSCVKSKMTRKPRPSTLGKDRNQLDLVHSDLSGPFPVPSYGNSLYYITLIDDATRVAWVRFMKQKSETTKIIKDFVTEMEHQHHKAPKAFRTDNGGEYVTNDLKGFFESKGIIHEFTPPYSPESNGVAERLNRTIGEAL
jgi:transposase InsO family protein